MRLSRRLAVSVALFAVLFVAANGLVPIGTRQAKPAQGSYSLDAVALAGSAAKTLPPAGGKPGTLGALARVGQPVTAPGPGWSARIELPTHPLMIALSWPGRHDGELQLRTSDGKTFGDWVDVDGMTSHGPDARDTNKGNDVTSTDPVWIGPDAAEVEVRVTKGTLAGLQLTKFDWKGTMPTAGSAGFGSQPAGAEPTQPAIHLRGDWDGGQGYRTDIAGCGSGPDVSPELKMAVVHHTVNANDYSQSQVPLLIRGIYQWHTQHNGWCDIGYNFLVDRFGGTWQGRSGDIAQPIWGAHAVGFNYDTMGVALLGSFQPGGTPAAVQPSAAMISSLVNVIAWKFGIHGVDALAKTNYVAGAGSHWPDGTTVSINTIVGHQDTSSTECPGANVEALLPSIRQRVEDRLNATRFPASRWAPFNNPRTLVAQQYQDILYRTANNADQAWWTNQMVTYGRSGAGIATSMIGAPETQATLVAMIRMYWAVFDRWADYNGMGLWVNQMRAGHSFAWVGDQFAKSPEYLKRYGNTSDQQFINLLYQNVLGRPADPAGQAVWLDHLQHGWTRGRVVAWFSNSAENVNRRAPYTHAGQVYFAMLHRPPDDGSFLWAVNLYNTGGLGSLVSTVWGSREYAMRVG